AQSQIAEEVTTGQRHESSFLQRTETTCDGVRPEAAGAPGPVVYGQPTRMSLESRETRPNSAFRSSPAPRRQNLGFEGPGRRPRVHRFAAPVKRIGRDFGERPARLRAVAARSVLHDVAAVPVADLFLAVAADRIRPRDAPRLNRRIPRAQRRAV